MNPSHFRLVLALFALLCTGFCVWLAAHPVTP